jgi:glycosyltransferase involved in cell wall biosynthesis
LSVESPVSQLFGVLVTFRRPELLRESLAAVNGQGRRLDHLVVVDNEPTDETREIVRRDAPGAEYIEAPDNLGPAGGIALGMERILERATDDDWIFTLDDDDPPLDPSLFAVLHRFATELAEKDPLVGAVGVEGVRFDRRRGRVVWVPDNELDGRVDVDSIGGRSHPCYSARVIRRVGTMRRDLFFGFEELELGLRLRDAGYSLCIPGSVWYARRRAQGLLGTTLVPSRSLGALTWRRYYSLRNLIRVLLDSGSTWGAVRVTLVVGFAKPLANFLTEPKGAWRHLRLNARACRDAWTGRMGRTIEPMS